MCPKKSGAMSSLARRRDSERFNGHCDSEKVSGFTINSACKWHGETALRAGIKLMGSVPAIILPFSNPSKTPSASTERGRCCTGQQWRQALSERRQMVKIRTKGLARDDFNGSQQLFHRLPVIGHPLAFDLLPRPSGIVGRVVLDLQHVRTRGTPELA